MNSTSTLAILEAVGNALRFLGDELLAITGSAAEETSEPEAAAPAKPSRKRSSKKAADPDPEADDEDQDDEDDEAEEPAPKPAAKGRAKKVTLEQLQELAAQLLEAGQRKELKSILTGAGAKSLSTADEKTYPKILEALTEAVDELED